MPKKRTGKTLNPTIRIHGVRHRLAAGGAGAVAGSHTTSRRAGSATTTDSGPDGACTYYRLPGFTPPLFHTKNRASKKCAQRLLPPLPSAPEPA